MQKIAVLDYGMGNLHSAVSALQQVAPDEEIALASTPAQAQGADRLLVPGVGAIRDCMAGFVETGFEPLLRDAIDAGLPILGVCVGMQIMMRRSEENDGVDCLDIFPQPVKFFGDDLRETEAVGACGSRLKVPHMGWNRVEQTREHPLWAGIENGSRFYFVHSYYVPADDNDQVAGRTDYGVPLAAAVARENIFATQFHPEKSADAGLQLLKNFVGWSGRA
ncbi:imidazole glycerol phosphate synthase subunit HisH [Microbulbifer halophilus]|uniref:Imidazole glycerol phosphate synthase subunit HisH n=1 Tax=Microbulbifer halophilus TaxID=453963 RepID=A0ABW5EFR4_9GAMM|nr:imidazole glycerol phosphate synthase subunit HisH [Microbulbifer halophilus]MCW8126255.1 imidazole glycerol phosphate synthase subunit HisH [Microbulbifer halophilus]